MENHLSKSVVITLKNPLNRGMTVNQRFTAGLRFTERLFVNLFAGALFFVFPIATASASTSAVQTTTPLT